MNKKSAKNIYRWLWFSPIFTIPTLGLFLEIADNEITAVLISAVWHLLLLIPATNLRKKFLSWHARQALLLAGVRTLIALFFYEVPGFAFVLLLIVWFFGTRWGQNEAEKGECRVMRWYGVTLNDPVEEGKEVAGNKEQLAPVHKTVAAPASSTQKNIKFTPESQAKPARKLSTKNQFLSCPKCGAPEKEKAIKCDSCGETYSAADLLKLRQLEYLLEKTQTWRGTEPYRKPFAAELQTLRERLFPPQQVEVTDEESKRARPAPFDQAQDKPAPVKKAEVKPQTIPVKSAAATVANPAIKKAKPAPKPKPKRDPIQWNKIWEKATEMVVSGALLRGLLYLGAFMIVVSATILVIRFWDEFPEVLQLILIAAVPTTFYLLSWGVRSKLKLPQAADVLTGIGALMVAVDFAAVYQFGGLSERFNGNAYWLVASIICLIIYVITSWRVSGEFFDYLALIGVTSVVLSITRLLEMPYEWSAVAMIATGVAFFALAAKFPHPNLPPSGEGTVLPPRGGDARRAEGGRGWRGIAQASRYYPHLLIIASLIFILFVPNASAWAQSFAFLLGALGYALMAWKFPKTIFAHATVWSFIFAVGFALSAIELHTEWYATAAGILAIPYILGGKRFTQVLPPSQPSPEGGRGKFSPFGGRLKREVNDKEILEKKEGEEKSKKEKSWQRGYQLAANIAGFSLTGIAILFGLFTIFTELWAGVFALTLATFILAGSAYLYKKPILVFLSGGLFNIPFLFAVDNLLTSARDVQTVILVMVAWGGLAIVYMGISLLLRKAEKYGQMLVLLAQLIIFPLLFCLLIFYEADLSQLPMLVALGTVILFYLLSAFLNHNDRHPALSTPLIKIPLIGHSIFVWATGFLFAIWFSLAWGETSYAPFWLGAGLAGLALVYIALGQILYPSPNLPQNGGGINSPPVLGGVRGGRGYNKTYRFPLHFYTYLLLFSGTLVAWSDQAALQTTLYLAVLALAWLSYIYKRMVESTLAALLFIVPFQQSLELSALSEHAYTLAYILLASLVYIPIGNFLAHTRKYQKEPHFEYPILIIGYLMSVFAVIASLQGRFDLYAVNYPLIGVEVPLIAAGLYIFSVYRYQKNRLFAEFFSALSVVIFVIAFGQALTLFKVPEEYLATAWVGLAFFYLAVEHFILGRRERKWFSPFHFSLGFGAVALALLGFILTTPYWEPSFSGNEELNRFPALLAGSLAVLFYATSAWVFKGKKIYYIFPYIASALAFFPYTLAWDLYSPPATYPQYAWIWMGLAAILLLVGYLLDRGWQAKLHERYAHGAYFVGYVLIVVSIFRSAPDYLSSLYTLAGAILLALISQVLVHYKKHFAFEDFINFWWRKETIARRVAQTFFLFFAAYAIPVWLAQLLTYNHIELAWRGFVLALLAPAYIAMGLVARRVRQEYTWAFFSAGYALSAIGAMIAFNDLKIVIVVLSLNAVVYAVSAYIFKEAFWLYLSTILVPIITLLSLHQTNILNDSWVSKIFMGLAFLYLFVGQIFDKKLHSYSVLPPSGEDARRTEGGNALNKISAFALPFYAPAFVLGAIALATASGERNLAIFIYLLGVLLYTISVKLFNETLFFYPAAWLFAVPYYLGMTLIPGLETRWYGLGWLPLVVFYILIGRFVFHKKPIKSPIFAHPAMPFYLLGYALSLSLIALSSTDPLALTLAFASASILYLASGALFRKSAWFYPGLFAAHMALLSYFTINPSGGGLHYISLPFLAMTWIMALVGYAFSKKFPTPRSKGFSPYFGRSERAAPEGYSVKALTTKVESWVFVRHLLTPSWAQPFFIFAALDIFIWQTISHPGFDTAIILAMGHALLLALFATLWMDSALVYGAIAFFLLAVGYQLDFAEIPFAESMAWFSGIGLGFYLLSRVSKQVEVRVKRCVIWTNPFSNIGIFLSAFAVIFSLPFIASYTSAAAFSFAFAGMLNLAIGYAKRRHYLGYLGMGMLLFAWVLLLMAQDVTEPQWYAIPAGIYFTVMGELERKRGRGVFAKIITGFGLAVLLMTSFAQSLGYDGFNYFIILLVEGLLVWWWGAARRQKVPFFAGLGASVLNIISQVIILVQDYNINRWITILGVGLLLMVIAIFVEKQRETIIARSKEWSDKLDSWE